MNWLDMRDRKEKGRLTVAYKKLACVDFLVSGGVVVDQSKVKDDQSLLI